MKRDQLSSAEPDLGPFSPQLATRPASGAGRTSTNQKVFSRLYEGSKMKQMRDKDRREAAEAAAEAELYVSPSSRKTISAKTATDMYERSMRSKAELERKREEIAERREEEHSFSPSLKTKRKGSTGTQRSAAERLYSSDHLQRRDERLNSAKSVNEMEGCTFSPRLVTRRRKSITPNDSTAVYARLYSKASSKNEVSYSEEKEGTFTPDITSSQRKVKASSSNNSAIYDRLYNKASEKKDSIHLEEESTFAPDITSSQRKVRASLSKSSVHERLHARASISPGRVPMMQSQIEASPMRMRSAKQRSSRIGQLYGKGMLKAQTELIAAQKIAAQELEKKAQEDSAPAALAEVQTAAVDVSLLDMDSPKGKDDNRVPSGENLDPTLNGKEVTSFNTPKKKYDTIDAPATGNARDVPQAYESGNGAKETIMGPTVEISTPGSLIGLGPSSESVGSMEFASI